MNQNKINQEKDYEHAQLSRFDGKNVFVETLNWAFGIGKMVLNFVSYDDSKAEGERKKEEITIFMDFDEFELLVNDVLSGKIPKLAQKELQETKASGNKYPKAVYLLRGGTSAEKLAAKGKSRPDGKAEARVLEIAPSVMSGYDFVLTAKVGPGNESDTGLISLAGKPEKQLRIPLTADNLKKMLIVGRSHIQVWRTIEYASYYKEISRKAKEYKNNKAS